MKKQPIIITMFCLALVITLSGCGQKNGASQKEIDKSMDESKKIIDQVNKENKAGLSAMVDFKDFLPKLKEEAASWAGGEYFFVMIENKAVTSNILKADSRNGKATAWQGSIVKCNEMKDPGKFEENQAKICKGNKRTFTMFINKDGETKTMNEDDSFSFYGSEYFSHDAVKVAASEAEAKANQAKSYNPKGVENYNLQLKKDGKTQKVVWSVAMSCPYAAQAENKCSENDHWSVKIDAETGEAVD
ncbi:MAG: hypothetical protein WCX17_03565 [Parcubacteria group bacterium]|jgi:hypothetical protein